MTPPPSPTVALSSTFCWQQASLGLRNGTCIESCCGARDIRKLAMQTHKRCGHVCPRFRQPCHLHSKECRRLSRMLTPLPASHENPPPSSPRSHDIRANSAPLLSAPLYRRMGQAPVQWWHSSEGDDLQSPIALPFRCLSTCTWSQSHHLQNAPCVRVCMRFQSRANSLCTGWTRHSDSWAARSVCSCNPGMLAWDARFGRLFRNARPRHRPAGRPRQQSYTAR